MRLTQLRLFIIIVVLVGVGLVAWLYPFPKNIHIEQKAIQYTQDDPASAVTTKIKVEGRMVRPLFRQASFEGHVSVDNFDLTQKDYMSTIYVLERKNHINKGSLTYNRMETPFDYSLIGLIYFSDDWREISMFLGSTGDERTQTHVVTGASNYEKAVEIQEKMRGK
ncbi:hypothetical protein MH215_12145 [Paenibacillus sp. ACRSA]|uniref:hypothetical protein n=1 Tax=Paenibacillus sp. ACRSA TaxID=2918211 RepID=UPI001EF60AE6|nr:hypothetical protein [Paenibacillus sp. ACRSA]MCG7377746.1 hypothetical protein [Paenibacillus sp. ACRSA]